MVKIIDFTLKIKDLTLAAKLGGGGHVPIYTARP